jgi:hypothetical protein
MIASNQKVLGVSSPIDNDVTAEQFLQEQDQPCHDPGWAVGPKKTRIRNAQQGHRYSFLTKYVVS